MSYFSQHNYSGSSYRYVVTPQMADIYAAVSMYGAATSTRTGDTVYGFNSNAGAIFNFGTYTSAPALTIYDSGGTDTLDCSGYSSPKESTFEPATSRRLADLPTMSELLQAVSSRTQSPAPGAIPSMETPRITG